jgi:hypothetical protein
VKSNIHLFEIHPQSSNNIHLVDGAFVSVGFLWPIFYVLKTMFVERKDEILKFYSCEVQKSYNAWELFIVREKKVFCNWPYNSIFELHRTLATHYIYTSWLIIGQSCMNCRIVIHYIYNATNCNSIKTIHFQLLCNFIIIIPMMSCWHYWLSSIY